MAQTYASVTVDSKSDSFSTEFNPFDEDNHTTFASTANVAESGIDYTNADGRFTVDTAGSYRVWGFLTLENLSGTFPANCTMRFKINDVTQFSMPIGIHAAADPWTYPFGFIFDLTAGQYATVTIEEDAADNIRSIEGTTLSIVRVA